MIKINTIHMREAIAKYLEAEESEQRFIAAAEQSLVDYKTDGLHISIEELSSWTSQLKTNPEAHLPPCHK